MEIFIKTIVGKTNWSAALSLTFALSILTGCSHEDSPTGPQNVLPKSRYEGQVTINMRESFAPYFPIERHDSITLSVSGEAYALTFQTQNSHICNSIGKLAYNKEVKFLIFDLDKSTEVGCDSVRIPRGSFATVMNGRDLNFEGNYIIRIPNSQRDDTIKYVFDLTAP